MRKDSNIKSIFLLLIYTFIFVLNVYAQHLNNSKINGVASNIPSPGSSSMGEFGIFPVSPYTGKADVQVPIYSMSVRGIKLDVSLCYNTSGLLINNLPGWTGHGWTLMAGGSITRKVNNQPDELIYSDTKCGYDFFEFDKEYATPAGSRGHGPVTMSSNEMEVCREFTNYFYSSSEVKKADKYDCFLRESEGTADYSADVFFFNFLGISGSFFYGNDGQWKVSCDRNIAILFDVYDESNYIENYGKNFTGSDIIQPKTIKGFTLVDENGTKYIFGGDQSSIEYVTDITLRHRYNTTKPWIASSWMLTKIRDRFDNELYSFNYSRGKKIVQLYNSFSNVRVGYDYSHESAAISGSVNAPVYLDEISAHSGITMSFYHDSVFVSERVDTILYPQFSCNKKLWEDMLKSTYSEYSDSVYRKFFNENRMQGLYDLEEMNLEKLNGISIYNQTNKSKIKISDYKFTYNCQNRMHLISLSVGDSLGTQKKYDFKYYDYDKLPKDYLTNEIDFWGYYNGKPKPITNSGFSETLARARISGNVSLKAPVLESSIYGMLQRLNYPTGGYSIFDYELNTYGKYLDDTKSKANDIVDSIEPKAGGLRIKAIESYDENEKMTGRKSYSYYYPNGKSSGVLYTQPNTHYTFKKNNVSIDVDYMCSIFPLSNSFSSNVGYSFVKETNIDNSYTTYEFSNYSDEFDEKYDLTMPDLEFPNPFIEFSSRDYKRGRLSRKIYYDRDGKIISEKKYKDLSDTEYNRGHYVSTTGFSIVGDGSNKIYIGGRYKLFYPKNNVTQVTNRQYLNGHCIENETYNEYRDSTIEVYGNSDTSYKVDIQQLVKSTSTTNINISSVEYKYTNDGRGFYPILCRDFFLAPILQKNYLNNNLVGGNKIVYGKCNNKYVPIYDIQFYESENICDTVIQYKSYTNSYMVAEYFDQFRIHHKIFYDLNDRPVARIDNSKIDIKPGLSIIPRLQHEAFEDSYDTKPVNTVMYSYNDRGQLGSVTSANKQSAYYKYNTWNELSSMLDNNRNVVKKYEYSNTSSDCSPREVESNMEPIIYCFNVSPVSEHYIKNIWYNKSSDRVEITIMMQSQAKKANVVSKVMWSPDIKSPAKTTDFVPKEGEQTIMVDMAELKKFNPMYAIRVDNEANDVYIRPLSIELYVDGKKQDSGNIDVEIRFINKYEEYKER